MAITEFVLPTFKQEPESAIAFTAKVAPSLNNLLDTHAAPPKLRCFGKILLENGSDVSGDFRPCLGIEWEHAGDFYTLVASEGFKAFGAVVEPRAAAPPNPQLYETDVGPGEVFGSALTEVWQVKIGDGDVGVGMGVGGKEEKARGAWKRFVGAVERVGGVKGKGIQGTSLNQEGGVWIGVLGWGSSEVREKVLGDAAVRDAKRGLDGLVWNTFVATFAL